MLQSHIKTITGGFWWERGLASLPLPSLITAICGNGVLGPTRPPWAPGSTAPEFAASELRMKQCDRARRGETGKSCDGRKVRMTVTVLLTLRIQYVRHVTAICCDTRMLCLMLNTLCDSVLVFRDMKKRQRKRKQPVIAAKSWAYVTWFGLTLCDPMDCRARLLCPWDSPGKNTGVGCHSLLQGIFPTQGSNPGLLHCKQMLYHLRQQRSLRRRDQGRGSSHSCSQHNQAEWISGGGNERNWVRSDPEHS